MLVRLWRGEIRLPFVFWILGVLISPLFFWLTFRFGKFLPGSFAMLMVFGTWLLYGIFISVVLWRSSRRYSGAKVWLWLSRIALCAAWVIFLGIGFGVFYFMGFDFFTTSYTVERQIERDPTLPFIGFWKNDCADNFGLAIEKAANDEYYVRFCGPGGCFGKTSFMRTKLINDPRYKILDNDTIGVDVSSTRRGLNPKERETLQGRMKDGLLIYKRCESTAAKSADEVDSSAPYVSNIGHTFTNLREVSDHYEKQGFIIWGRFEHGNWPAKVVHEKEASDEIYFTLKNGQRHVYPGYAGFRLKAVALEDETGGEIMIVLRSKKKDLNQQAH